MIRVPVLVPGSVAFERLAGLAATLQWEPVKTAGPRGPLSCFWLRCLHSSGEPRRRTEQVSGRQMHVEKSRPLDAVDPL